MTLIFIMKFSFIAFGIGNAWGTTIILKTDTLTPCTLSANLGSEFPYITLSNAVSVQFVMGGVSRGTDVLFTRPRSCQPTLKASWIRTNPVHTSTPWSTDTLSLAV